MKINVTFSVNLPEDSQSSAYVQMTTALDRGLGQASDWRIDHCTTVGDSGTLRGTTGAAIGTWEVTA